MTRLPGVTGKQVIAALNRMGFQEIRIRGSHHYMRHSDGRATVVPVHAGETIGRGLLSIDSPGCGDQQGGSGGKPVKWRRPLAGRCNRRAAPG